MRKPRNAPALVGDCGEPLLSESADLRNLCWMKLDLCRMQNSDFMHLANNEEFGAALKLWTAAMRQVPAGSLPNNDRIIASLAGYANAPRQWSRVREMALYGWVPCNDDRLYHPVISEMVLEVQASKGSVLHSARTPHEDAADERKRKTRDRVRRWRKSKAEEAAMASESPDADISVQNLVTIDTSSVEHAPEVEAKNRAKTKQMAAPGETIQLASIKLTPDNANHLMPYAMSNDVRNSVTGGVTPSITVTRYSVTESVTRNAVTPLDIDRDTDKDKNKDAVTLESVTAKEEDNPVTRDVTRKTQPLVTPDVTLSTTTQDGGKPAIQLRTILFSTETNMQDTERKDRAVQKNAYHDGNNDAPVSSLNASRESTKSVATENAVAHHDEKLFSTSETHGENVVRDDVQKMPCKAHETPTLTTKSGGSLHANQVENTASAEAGFDLLALFEQEDVSSVNDLYGVGVQDGQQDLFTAPPMMTEAECLALWAEDGCADIVDACDVMLTPSVEVEHVQPETDADTFGYAADIGKKRQTSSSAEKDVRDEPRDDRPQTQPASMTGDADVQRSMAVNDLFCYWQKTMNRHRAHLDDKRRRRIAWGLKHYSIEECMQAIDGCKASRFHMGDNNAHKTYNDLTLIFRDAAHFEDFLAIARKEQRGHGDKIQQYQEQASSWAENMRKGSEFVDAEYTVIDPQKAPVSESFRPVQQKTNPILDSILGERQHATF